MKSILEEDPQLGRIVVVMMDLFFVVVRDLELKASHNAPLAPSCTPKTRQQS